jgi:uncharacterized protein YrrD
MLRTVKELEKYTVGATDGLIGHIKDFYFDDEAWVVRYAVVATGGWLSGREVLVSPYALGQADPGALSLPASISRAQVENSPSIETQKPVSRQHEIAYLSYYGYPYYWGGSGIWGGGAYPGAMLAGVEFGGSDAAYAKAETVHDRDMLSARSKQDPHLRSCHAVKGYHIHATDGEIGHVQGYIVDEHTWAIQYLIVDTSNWWLGHQVLVAPEWISEISWLRSMVTTVLTRQEIKSAPVYDAAVPLDRVTETGTYRHYGRRAYWQHPRAAA